jgi:two-component system, NarL family, sensor kinase
MIPVDLDVPARLPKLPPAVEIAVYRIAAEALTNTVRHSGASHATVRVVAHEETLELTVADKERASATERPPPEWGWCR